MNPLGKPLGPRWSSIPTAPMMGSRARRARSGDRHPVTVNVKPWAAPRSVHGDTTAFPSVMYKLENSSCEVGQKAWIPSRGGLARSSAAAPDSVA